MSVSRPVNAGDTWASIGSARNACSRTGIEIGFSVECPYCGHSQFVNRTHSAPPRQRQTEIVYCNEVDGGCDRRFVADFTIEAYAASFGIDREAGE